MSQSNQIQKLERELGFTSPDFSPSKIGHLEDIAELRELLVCLKDDNDVIEAVGQSNAYNAFPLLLLYFLLILNSSEKIQGAIENKQRREDIRKHLNVVQNRIIELEVEQAQVEAMTPEEKTERAMQLMRKKFENTSVIDELAIIDEYTKNGEFDLLEHILESVQPLIMSGLIDDEPMNYIVKNYESFLNTHFSEQILKERTQLKKMLIDEHMLEYRSRDEILNYLKDLSSLCYFPDTPKPTKDEYPLFFKYMDIFHETDQVTQDMYLEYHTYIGSNFRSSSIYSGKFGELPESIS